MQVGVCVLSEAAAAVRLNEKYGQQNELESDASGVMDSSRLLAVSNMKCHHRLCAYLRRLWPGLEQLLRVQPLCAARPGGAGASALAGHMHSHLLRRRHSAGRADHGQLCSRWAPLP